MTVYPAWLPDLLLFSAHGGDWPRYEAALFAVFEAAFVRTNPAFRNGQVGLGWSPIVDGKPKTFWHVTSEGNVEVDRTPDFRRCERIGWPKAVITAAAGQEVRCWPEMRGRERRWLIALEDFSYVVIVAEGRQKYVLVTAFPVEDERRRKKMQKDWSTWNEAQKS